MKITLEVSQETLQGVADEAIRKYAETVVYEFLRTAKFRAMAHEAFVEAERTLVANAFKDGLKPYFAECEKYIVRSLTGRLKSMLKAYLNTYVDFRDYPATPMIELLIRAEEALERVGEEEILRKIAKGG